MKVFVQNRKARLVSGRDAADAMRFRLRDLREQSARARSSDGGRGSAVEYHVTVYDLPYCQTSRQDTVIAAAERPAT